MLIVEDLHWLDDESQALLDLLVEQMADARLLLLVNFRPEYQLRWGDKSYAQSLRLDALGHDNADEMLSAMLGKSDEPVAAEAAHHRDDRRHAVLHGRDGSGPVRRRRVDAIRRLGQADQAARVVAHSADRANHPRRAHRPAARRREDAPANSCRARPRIRPQSRESRRRTLGRGARTSHRQFAAWRVRLRAAVNLGRRIYLQARAHAGGRLQLDPAGAPQATARGCGARHRAAVPLVLGRSPRGSGAPLLAQRQSGEGGRISPARRRAGHGARARCIRPCRTWKARSRC